MIFVDTSFWLALWSERDPDHERAVAVLQTLEGRRLPELLVTSNHVVFETLTLAQARAGHQLAVRAGTYLYSENMARIVWATKDEEKAAFDYMVRHGGQGYSSVDCLSFVLMHRFRIHEAFTLDKHFTHRYVIRPGP